MLAFGPVATTFASSFGLSLAFLTAAFLLADFFLRAGLLAAGLLFASVASGFDSAVFSTTGFGDLSELTLVLLAALSSLVAAALAGLAFVDLALAGFLSGVSVEDVDGLALDPVLADGAGVAVSADLGFASADAFESAFTGWL